MMWLPHPVSREHVYTPVVTCVFRPDADAVLSDLDAVDSVLSSTATTTDSEICALRDRVARFSSVDRWCAAAGPRFVALRMLCAHDVTTTAQIAFWMLLRGRVEAAPVVEFLMVLTSMLTVRTVGDYTSVESQLGGLADTLTRTLKHTDLPFFPTATSISDPAIYVDVVIRRHASALNALLVLLSQKSAAVGLDPLFEHDMSPACVSAPTSFVRGSLTSTHVKLLLAPFLLPYAAILTTSGIGTNMKAAATVVHPFTVSDGTPPMTVILLLSHARSYVPASLLPHFDATRETIVTLL